MIILVRSANEQIDTSDVMIHLEYMLRTVVPYLMRAICLLLVIATGMSSVAYADHGEGHGTHCIVTTAAEKPVQHDHAARENIQPSHHEVDGQNCVQHSCVAVFGHLSLTGAVHRLASGKAKLGGDPLRAVWRAENLHRPPIA